MKKAIYTVCLDGYDYFPRPAINNPGWDKIVFTDQDLTPAVSARWDQVIKIEATDRPDIKCREVKWLSHKLLPEYDLVCYHDANMSVIRTLPDIPFRIKHFKRNSVREEADACNRQVHRWTVEAIDSQMDHYIKTGFKDKQGLFLNGFFARYHTEVENNVCEMVFDHVKKFTSRDQIAMPYAVWKYGYEPENKVDGKFYLRHIRMRHHKKKHKILGGMISIHHITPARSDKNYGKAINDIVKVLPDDDWICLRDIDTLPLDHVSFIKQCEEIAKANEYGIVSCMTNRLGLPWQLVYDEIQKEEDVNMIQEVIIAKEMAKEHGSKVEEAPREVAGVMMLFPKSVWTEVGGFKEGGIIWGNQMLDNIFYEAVKAKGYKIGLAKGIYLLHLYRWNENPRTYKKHLK